MKSCFVWAYRQYHIICIVPLSNFLLAYDLNPMFNNIILFVKGAMMLRIQNHLLITFWKENLSEVDIEEFNSVMHIDNETFQSSYSLLYWQTSHNVHLLNTQTYLGFDSNSP